MRGAARRAILALAALPMRTFGVVAPADALIVGTIKHAAIISPTGSLLELPQRRARMVVIELLLK
jgi:hypothetical protein